jgi:DNA-binding NtrC family response regulator
MRQPMLAPAAFGGSVVAGVAAMLVSGYRIVDCIQFRTGPGACDQVISDNAMPLVAGVAAIAGSFGGLWTYNPSLRREGEPAVEPEPLPVAGLVDDPDQEPPDERAAIAHELRAQGLTQQEIAAELGVSRSTVQRLLRQ